jgi:16S rRNA G966 N2-methylase RsmD
MHVLIKAISLLPCAAGIFFVFPYKNCRASLHGSLLLEQSEILLGNIDNCKAGEKSVPMNCDFKTALARIDTTLDVVIMDPPYDQLDYYPQAMEILQERGLLDEGSVIVAEHLYDNPLQEKYGRLTRIKEKKYGSIGVDVYIFE